MQSFATGVPNHAHLKQSLHIIHHFSHGSALSEKQQGNPEHICYHVTLINRSKFQIYIICFCVYLGWGLGIFLSIGFYLNHKFAISYELLEDSSIAKHRATRSCADLAHPFCFDEYELIIHVPWNKHDISNAFVYIFMIYDSHIVLWMQF